MLHWLKTLDRVLKGELTRPAALGSGGIELPVGGMTVLLVLLGAAYGSCMGTYAVVVHWSTATSAAGWVQLGYSAAKVPMLFVLTLIVTFPSLYVFNALVGSRLSMQAVLRLLVAALAVTLAVLASFGTITAFFSLCTTSYPFMVLLNVLLFAVAGVLGMGFLLQTLHRLSAAQGAWEPPPAAPAALPVAPVPSPGALDRVEAHANASSVKAVFRVWVLVFGLVGAQMGWVLRPFIGAPDVPPTFLRARESNFFQAVALKLEELASGTTPQRDGGTPPQTQPATAPGWGAPPGGR